MISKKFKDMCNTPSVIRALAGYANERGKEIGYENVFDYTLGNPSVPVPEEFNKALRDLTAELPSSALHGYSHNSGIP